jgi:hypothetical protein
MKTTTLEFSKANDRIMVNYNFESITLTQFCRLEGAKTILVKMCCAIRRQCKEENPCGNPVCIQAINKGLVNCNNYIETVGTFIKNHFLKNDIVIDVIISEDSDRVDFNIEEG